MAVRHNQSVKLETYHRAITKAHDAPADDEATRLAELAALIEFSLGHPLEPTEFSLLADIQKSQRAADDNLARSLEQGEISPEDFMLRSDDISAEVMRKIFALLGAERYRLIFGDEPPDARGMFDKETFLKTQASRRR